MNRNYIQLSLRQTAKTDTEEVVQDDENDIYPEPDFNNTGLKNLDDDACADTVHEHLHDSSVSIQGRVVRYLIGHITNDMAIGKKIKSGELRKRMQEPAWKVPDCFNMTSIDMPEFSMKLLTSKENPNTDRIILQLHGGGYIGAVRNAYYVFAGLYNEVSRKCSVLTPDYRVAPEHPFPAALEDAVSSYEWLLNQGWKGEQIIIAGDSAGGGLAMALTMYLRDNNMPMPVGIVAMSPWTDVTASGESYETNYEKDPLFGNTRESMIYINDYPGDNDPKNPYISPLFGDFTGFPPMLIQAGSIEMLLSDSVVAAEKARKQGVKVRLSIYEGMFHVFQMSYLNIPESRKAWQEVGKFLELI
jgi:acetyl esterase/lipase